MSQFEKISLDYIKNLAMSLKSEGFTDQQTPELSFRPNLDKYFRDLSGLINSDIEIIFEPRMQKKAGRPDWRFHHKTHLGIFGYVEAKALDMKSPINVPDYENQVRKYISLGHKVILTDGIEFVFFDPESKTAETMSLIQKPINSDSLTTASVDPRLENKFKDFFQEASFRKCSEEELVQAVAKRAIQLSESVQELVAIPEGAGFTEIENKTILVLHKLYKVVAEHHDSRLSSPKAFGDFVAQVLSFGLLYAHRIIRDTANDPAKKQKALTKFWYDDFFANFSNELGPFKELSNFLREELEYLGYLGTWYQDSLMFLSYVELERSQIQAPDYHILFERFLDKFDPETKFDFGAFYTPTVLSNYAVAFSDMVIRKDLSSNLFDIQNKIIDPCCGTGTFLESLLNFNESKELPSLIGFEILPGPYALAQYRIRTIVKSEGRRGSIKILLTNTLSDELNKQQAQETGTIDLFSAERQKARDLSRPPITLVIGNPPSSDSSNYESQNESVIDTLLEDFRPPEEQRSGRQNTQKQISNPFVKFLRWSTLKVMESNLGAISLVLPSSFLENASYKWARKFLIENFSHIYVLDIDSDLRASDAQNIFNVQQGRCLVTAIYKKSVGPAKVFYDSITGLNRADKILKFQQDYRNINLNSFDEFNVDAEWCLIPRKTTSDLDYETQFWKIFDQSNSVFARNCNGLKLSPTAFFIHAKRDILKRRIIEFSRMNTSAVEEGLNRWFKRQAKPPRVDKFSSDVLATIPKQADGIDSRIKIYSHRPFLNLHAYIDESIMKELAGTDGGGARFRPEIVSAYSVTGNIGIAIAPSPKELGNELHQFVSFCWGIPDNDLCARGNAKILSLLFPEYKKPRVDWNSAPLKNISTSLVDKIRKIGISDQNLDELVLFYTYGIMCSDFYLLKYKDFLFRTSGLSPKIPFTDDPLLFAQIAASGRRLAEMEKVKILSNQELPLQFQAEITPFKLTSVDYDEESKELKLYEGKVEKYKIGGIEKGLATFSISGYVVIATWCKFNSFPYTRTEFNKNSLAELGSLIRNLEAYLSEKKHIDVLVQNIFQNRGLIRPD